MRITLHDYVSDPALSQRDGVNLAHENIAALMRSSQCKHDVTFHDFNHLLSDDFYARDILGPCDCVIANVGPHAHYYFYLREKLGLTYRIVRDARTAIWSSYLLQEHLCAPLLRADDILMVASHYTRGLYERFFPHLTNFPTLRCYPLGVSFPPRPKQRKRLLSEAQVTIGYLGRLSEDKNFSDVVELVTRLNERGQGRYTLLACGDIHSASCDPGLILKKMQARLGHGNWFEHLHARSHDQIWDVLERFDIMVFPSTSNLETFGRVLIEASYAGVPILAGAHAAAPELLPASSLCPVAYIHQDTLSAHFDHQLGKISVDDMINVLASDQLTAAACHEEYMAHPGLFLDALAMTPAEVSALGGLELRSTQAEFIDIVNLAMPSPLTRAGAHSAIEAMVPWFMGLQEKGSERRSHLIARLAELSRHPDRTMRYIARSAGTACDFTNVGGIDIELCNIIDFHPEFSIQPKPGT